MGSKRIKAKTFKFQNEGVQLKRDDGETFRLFFSTNRSLDESVTIWKKKLWSHSHLKEMFLSKHRIVQVQDLPIPTDLALGNTGLCKCSTCESRQTKLWKHRVVQVQHLRILTDQALGNTGLCKCSTCESRQTKLWEMQGCASAAPANPDRPSSGKHRVVQVQHLRILTDQALGNTGLCKCSTCEDRPSSGKCRVVQVQHLPIPTDKALWNTGLCKCSSFYTQQN